jgi:thiol-disulfide isomerase/thioredoxin
MKSCGTILSIVLLGCTAAWQALAADPATYEEMKDALRAKGLSHTSLMADFAMDMSMQGMAMKATGDIQGKGAAMIMNMTMDMPGMPEGMSMKMIMDLDGIMWIESSAGGMNQVMKMDMNKIKAMMEESGMDLPFDSSMSDFMGQMTDPVAFLEKSEPFLDFTLDGVDTVNGDAVYVLNADVTAAGFQGFDPTGMLGRMGDGKIDNYKMYLGVDDGFMRKMEMGMDGMTMVQTYSNIRLNEEMSDDLFVYTPPAGAQVMDMMEMIESQMNASGGGGNARGRYKAGDSNLPDVLGKDLNGKEVKLSDHLGKVVLVDFWATWCPPCIEELPNVLATYAKYKNKGFVILGVSLDNAVSDLTEFQADHPDMTWVQVCEAKGWDSAIVGTYGVEAIPHTLLLDQTGTVVAADLHGDALGDTIAGLLAK